MAVLAAAIIAYSQYIIIKTDHLRISPLPLLQLQANVRLEKQQQKTK
jgi:hypothetical protein